MLTVAQLRRYVGHEVRLQTDAGVVEGELVAVDRNGLQLANAAIGWETFADVTLVRSAVVSIASTASPDALILEVGMALSREFVETGVEPFQAIRERLCWITLLPPVRGHDNMMMPGWAFSVRSGRMIVAEGEAFDVATVAEAIAAFYIPAPHEC